MTDNKEDYLKAVYNLGGHRKQVNNKEIAKVLGVSAPSVSEMIKKLLDEGYLEYTPYKGIRLTEYGKKEAISVIRRHRLWEVLLVEHLGYSWHEVNEEAEKLEHVTNLKLEKRLDKYLNYPKACPHGSPIFQNEIGLSKYRTLDTLDVGEETTIRRVFDERQLLQYVDSLGLNIGDEIKVVDLAPYNGPITLRKNEKDIIIGKEAANNIFVD
ncbi:metal-dependent transcriptional regulator [Clostridium algidicarnis]|uniref:Manganese transport regulator n=2 Tax=Clostridium algidicarnis TaxID=37659 RepID=A0A2S6FVX6_9CLOT|nr:metal-dependent transcriptional regulator [Clostridium algidicarnis]MBB6632081.1 metal-dependent transcriptional regulator [Clostridium algidicarnis]MBB6698404.1 metal-dependent transcriptional regulator [Clostridium algidicarnis]MBU3193740.1 metal-dependent transcriptional regulator [Clostridium algidicarnis]MBU3207253.1 metal-dependent transcriptional regulator [Clostridium algidicarnis]MBU3220526.1 metal-dependent transcriptional regulator [Clostridium algidicarnis]